MDIPAPFYAVGDHIAIDLAGARAVFTTRRGGHSRAPYDSFNLGLMTEDDPGAVRANRAALARRFGVAFAYGRQVHGTRVAVASTATDAGAPLTEADGHVTATPGVAPLVLTADCLPIAVAGERAVAMLHAGWRGLAAGVIGEGVRTLRELGSEGPLRAAIGPGAGVCCYEVGEEVHAALGAVAASEAGGGNADLKSAASHQLASAGVTEVHDVGLCTICCAPGLFFSHRRDHGLTGRQAGTAWLI